MAEDGPEAGAALASLVGAGLAVPCIDGVDRALPGPRRGCLDAGDHVGGGESCRVPALVLQRAPGRRVQVAGGDRGLRSGAGPDPRVQRPGRGRRGHHLPERDRGDQPPRLPAPVRTGGRRGHDGRRAPRQPTPVGPGGRAAVRRVQPGGDVRRGRRRGGAGRRGQGGTPAGAVGGDGGVERDGLAAAGDGDLRGGARARASGWRSTRRSWRRTGRCRRARTSWRSAATSSTHRSARAVLVGPREAFVDGEPFLAGGGAVDLVDIDEVIWTEPPEREEAGSPNVVGAVAFDAAMAELSAIGWPAIVAHETWLAGRLRRGLAAIDGVTLLGPEPAGGRRGRGGSGGRGVHGRGDAPCAGRGPAQRGNGPSASGTVASVRTRTCCGCWASGRGRWRRRGGRCWRGDRRHIPGAVRASGGLGTTDEDVDAAAGRGRRAGGWRRHRRSRTPQDPVTGDFFPDSDRIGWASADRPAGSACARG